MARKVVFLPGGYEDDYSGEEDLLEHLDRQLKICVAPDKTIGAGLNNTNFDKTLTPQQQSSFEFISQEFSTYHNVLNIKNQLKSIYMKEPAPHKLALKFYLRCPQSKYRGLAALVVHALSEVVQEKSPDIPCDDNTRMVAFNLMKNEKAKTMETMVTTFELHKINAFLIPKIKEIIKDGQYKLAADWAIVLGLTDEFGILDIVFPLVLNNSLGAVFDYLKASKSLQIPTVQFLDSLLDKKLTPYQKCERILEVYNYKNLKFGSLQKNRLLSKKINTICKTLKIPETYVPNQTFLNTLSYIRHLTNEYTRDRIGFEAWRELIQESASTKDLQLGVVEDMVDQGFIDEALFWTDNFKLHFDECPIIIQQKKKEQRRSRKLNSSNSSNSSLDLVQHKPKPDKYLQLALSDKNIIYVDNQVKFLDMIQHLLQQEIIAFDSEWKPVHSNTEASTISLLQFATKDRVFLIDCLAKDIKPEIWSQLESNVFNNLDILKLGFAMIHDMKVLSATLPLKFNTKMKAGYLDIFDLYNYLKNLNLIKFPFNKHESATGLSKLAAACLGKPLDKTNQISNWTRRPLRQEQITYAALDAYCLIQIYDVIENLLTQNHLDINEIIEDLHNDKSVYKNRVQKNLNDSSNDASSKSSSKNKTRKRKKNNQRKSQ